MNNNKKYVIICLFTLLACVFMAVVDGVFMPPYFIKSIIKLVVFLATPLIFVYFNKNIKISDIITFSKKGLFISLILGISIYAVIILGYFALRNVFDFSHVTQSLTQNIGVTKENFIFVSLYISFINSLLEEFFFRGFTFSMLLKKSKKLAYIYSSLIFSLYHIAMMSGWFSIGIFAFLLIGLFLGGLIFSYLNEKTKTIFTSYLVHMFANLAINTVGFILFDAA